MARDFWNGDDLEYEQFYDENCEDAKEDVLTDIIKDRKKLIDLLEDTDYFEDMLNAKISLLFNERGFNEWKN